MSDTCCLVSDIWCSYLSAGLVTKGRAVMKARTTRSTAMVVGRRGEGSVGAAVLFLSTVRACWRMNSPTGFLKAAQNFLEYTQHLDF